MFSKVKGKMEMPGFEKTDTSMKLMFKIFLESSSHKTALKYLLSDSVIEFVHRVELIFLRYSSV